MHHVTMWLPGPHLHLEGDEAWLYSGHRGIFQLLPAETLIWQRVMASPNCQRKDPTRRPPSQPFAPTHPCNHVG